MNKLKKLISLATQKHNNIRIKYLEIKDYTNLDEVIKQVDKVENFGTRKSSWNALIHYYNSQSTSITNSDKILELLHKF